MNRRSMIEVGLDETMDLCKLIIFLIPNTQLDPRPDEGCELFIGQELDKGVGHVHPYIHTIERSRSSDHV
jgi:hypothetical protein